VSPGSVVESSKAAVEDEPPEANLASGLLSVIIAIHKLLNGSEIRRGQMSDIPTSLFDVLHRWMRDIRLAMVPRILSISLQLSSTIWVIK
jgi:hypothetical protein